MTSINGALNALLRAQSSAVNQQITFAVAAKSLEATRQYGEAAVELLDAAAQLSKAPGRGKHFDAVA